MNNESEAAKSINLKLFWEKVRKTSSCWEWTGAKTHNGYGVVRTSRPRMTVRVHRISYIIHKKIIPKGLMILHSCDNRCCVNPAHLSAGTARENTLDMMKKRRHSKPPNNSEARKTKIPDEVIKMLGTVPDTEIAKVLKVNPSVINRRRKSIGVKAFNPKIKSNKK